MRYFCRFHVKPIMLTFSSCNSTYRSIVGTYHYNVNFCFCFSKLISAWNRVTRRWRNQLHSSIIWLEYFSFNLKVKLKLTNHKYLMAIYNCKLSSKIVRVVYSIQNIVLDLVTDPFYSLRRSLEQRVTFRIIKNFSGRKKKSI